MVIKPKEVKQKLLMKDDIGMAKKNSKIIREAYGEYEVLTGEAEAKRLEEIRQMSRMEEKAALSAERERGEEEGIRLGITQGQKQKQIEIAKNMLEENLPLKQIAKFTGLTEEEISNIENNINN